MNERAKFNRWWADNHPPHYEMHKEQHWRTWLARAELGA